MFPEEIILLQTKSLPPDKRELATFEMLIPFLYERNKPDKG